MSTGEGGLSQMSVDIYLTSTNILIPCCLVAVVAWETQRAFTSKVGATVVCRSRAASTLHQSHC
jgi:hypothetical protein